jgi:hypothetical protein
VGIFKWDVLYNLRYIIFGFLYLLSLMLILGKLKRWQLVLFLFLLLNIFWQNPYILHESQPMAFIMLLSFLFLPLKKSELLKPIYPRTLIIFLGIYYFFAAYKKLPDSNWRNGTAIWHLMQWQVLANSLKINNWFIETFPVEAFKGLVYGVLVFEFTFLSLVFTRFKKYLITAGLTMHFLISAFLDIGSLGQLMIVWYALI